MGLISRVSSRTYRERKSTNMLFRKALQATIRTQSARSMGDNATRKSKDFWKLSSIYGVPIWLAATCIFVWRREQEHHAHYTRPEFIAWPWLHIRTRKYPWRDGHQSLFHIKGVIPIKSKGGYEPNPARDHAHH